VLKDHRLTPVAEPIEEALVGPSSNPTRGMTRQVRTGMTERASTNRSRTHSSAHVVAEGPRGYNVPGRGVASVMALAETTARSIAAATLH
jgi:hypothetical protein